MEKTLSLNYEEHEYMHARLPLRTSTAQGYHKNTRYRGDEVTQNNCGDTIQTWRLWEVPMH